MGEKVGVENLLLLTEALGSIGTVIGDVFEDGKIDWKDAPSAMGLFSSLQSLSNVDFSEILPEVGDIDETEMVILGDAFDKTFDLTNDVLEQKIEEGLDYLADGVKAVQFLLSIRKG